MGVGGTPAALATLAHPLDEEDVGGRGHAGAGQRDVASRLRYKVGLLFPA